MKAGEGTRIRRSWYISRTGLTLTSMVLVGLFSVAQATAAEIEFSSPLALGTTLNNPSRLCEESLATDRNGNWVVAWESTDTLNGTVGEDADVMVSISGDNGVTWSETAPLNINASSDSGDDGRVTVATDGNGVWIAAWPSTDDLGIGLDDDKDILFARSLDNGATWSAPAPLNSYAATDKRNKNDSGTRDDEPHLATDGQGTWVATWNCLGGDGTIISSRSTDNGMTWGDERVVTVTTSVSPILFPPEWFNCLAYGNGRWVIVSTNLDLFMYDSADGVNWSEQRVLHNASETDCSDWHPHLASDGLGNWVIAWYMNAPDVRSTVYTMRSRDDGATWSEPARVTSIPSHSENEPQVATNGTGEWVLVFPVYGDPGAFHGEDRDIMAYTSVDTGETWTGPSIVNADALEDLEFDGSPQIKAGVNGRWVSTWDSLTEDSCLVQCLAVANYPTSVAVPGVTVAPLAGLETTEDGGTDVFTVVLDAAPSASVSIAVNTSDASEGAPDTSALSFDASNWDVPQTVTVTGVDDPDIDGDILYSIVLAPAVSSDASYSGIDPLDVAMANKDNEQPQRAFISRIDYTIGGWKDSVIGVRVKVVNELSVPVEGALVAADLQLNGDLLAVWSGTTNSLGYAYYELQYGRAKTAVFTTVITEVVADGLTWDGITPPNSFTK